MPWSYSNPVEVHFGPGSLNRLETVLRSRDYGLVTYNEPVFAEWTERVAVLAHAPTVIVDNISPNPHFAALSESCALFARARRTPEVIVALGGGSVIDAAKVLSAAKGDFDRVRQYLETGDGAGSLGAVPIIAIPTTAGTGSDVTCWATVWDIETQKKYSLTHPALYPEAAIIDPELTRDLPRDLTIGPALDAMSHALESLWNVNANPVSRTLAVAAAREMLDVLPRLVENLGDIALRSRTARAALFAGLAFSNTRTALAHSLSYPITLRHGVPHGLACSFSLPMVMRGVIGTDPDCDGALRDIFGPDLEAGAERLAGFLTGLGVSLDPADYGIGEAQWDELIDLAFASERGKNFIGTQERVTAVARSGFGHPATKLRRAAGHA